MADINAFSGMVHPPINWGKWALIAIGAVFSVLLLVIPMVWIVIAAFSEGIAMVGQNIFDPDMLHAIWPCWWR
jgi:sulfate transport system permease protein